MDPNDNPVGAAPDPRAPLMAEEEALLRARGDHPEVPARAALMRYREVAALDRALAAGTVVHPDRWVWLVTVHTEVQVRGGLYVPQGPPVSRTAQVYSVVIDAETGIMTDWGIGSEALRDESAVETERPAARWTVDDRAGPPHVAEPAHPPLPPTARVLRKARRQGATLQGTRRRSDTWPTS